MNMILITILFVLRLNVIFAYNIHEKPASMLRDTTASYLGYSIILHAQKNPPKSWLIVGAPNSKLASVEEPGLVYKHDLQSQPSQPVRVQPKELREEQGFVASVNYHSVIKKDYGWFGASMAVDTHHNVLKVCAPRSMITLYTFSRRFQSMHGVCYVGDITADRLELEDKNLGGHEFVTEFWYNPLHGFSLHYPSSSSGKKHAMIIGSPKEELSGSVFIKGQFGPVYFPQTDDSTMVGYSVFSGYFFGNEKLLYAGGAPGWNLRGRVGIIDPTKNPGSVIANVYGTTIGEFFGASLTACDLNNDGFDEIIVGAPYWGEDHGRVYIYLGNPGAMLGEADVIVDGHKEYGRFGYSLACGDLDQDGFHDLIVGAPWENNGVVYIYNGDLLLQSKFKMSSQNITVTSPVFTFGFSIAKPVDIDFNGFPDLAVGAYKSNYAMVLNSHPVVKSNIQAYTIPPTLNKNSTSFVVKVCVNHTKLDSPSHESFNLSISIDEALNRVRLPHINLSHISSWDDTHPTVCLYTPIYLMEVITNYIDPITITIVHNYGKSSISEHTGLVECSLCSIEHTGSSNFQEITIPFDIECGSDKICNSSISLSGFFHDQSNDKSLENNTWIIGSQDISLQVDIWNDGEPAYSTDLILILPKKTGLRKVLDSCRTKEENSMMKVICDVANPLFAGSQKSIIFHLDMSKINNGSLDNTNLTFTALVRTQSRQEGDSSVDFPLFLSTNASLILEGRANERSYEILSGDNSTGDISFEHLYRISKIGFTPVAAIRLAVTVPYRIESTDLVVLMNEPEISTSGTLFQCFVNSIPINQSQRDTPRIMISNDTQKFELNGNNSIKRSAETSFRTYGNTFLNDSDVFSPSTPSGAHLRPLNDSEIICFFNGLIGNEDSIRLTLQFSINFPRLMEEDASDRNKIMEFATEAWVDVVQPVNWTILGIGNVTKVITTFIHIAPIRRLNVWLIAGCIFLGLLALFLIAIGLKLVGFFDRNQSEKMDAINDGDGNKTNNRLSKTKL